MKKFATIALAVVLSMGILTGCGSSKKAAEATTEVKEETVDYGQGLNEDGTLEGVKATDYVTFWITRRATRRLNFPRNLTRCLHKHRNVFCRWLS